MTVLPTIEGDIYDYPKYYDLVYGSDWQAEYEFLTGLFQKHVDFEVQTLFEPACGTGRLLYRFAKKGFQVAGNDLNEKAIEFCNQRLAKHGFAETAVVGDMTRFELDEPVDAAFNTINSFRHLLTHEMARDHLTCMSRAIKPGGIYVLGLHLSPTDGETCDAESWSATRGYLTVNSSMWLVERNYPERYERFGMTFDVYMPTKQFQIKNEVKFRTYTSQQLLELIAAVPQFEIVESYDFCYDLDEPIEIDESVEDVVVILKNRG